MDSLTLTHHAQIYYMYNNCSSCCIRNSGFLNLISILSLCKISTHTIELKFYYRKIAIWLYAAVFIMYTIYLNKQNKITSFHIFFSFVYRKPHWMRESNFVAFLLTKKINMKNKMRVKSRMWRNDKLVQKKWYFGKYMDTVHLV